MVGEDHTFTLLKWGYVLASCGIACVDLCKYEALALLATPSSGCASLRLSFFTPQSFEGRVILLYSEFY